MENKDKNHRISCVLFDLDNTLIETRKADSKVCEKMAKFLTNKYNISREEAASMSTNFLINFRKCPDNPRMSLDMWRTRLWSKALGEKYREDAEIVYKLWLVLRYRNLAVRSDVISLLENLRKAYLVGLITNGTHAAQWEKIDRLGLRSYFDAIVVSGDFPWEKPHRNIFIEACDHLKVAPKDCVMVGDKLETDILGGIEANLGATVWIPLTGRCDLTEGDPNPDYVIKDVVDLKGLLPKFKENKSKVKGGPPYRMTFMDVDDCNSNGSDGS